MYIVHTYVHTFIPQAGAEDRGLRMGKIRQLAHPLNGGFNGRESGSIVQYCACCIVIHVQTCNREGHETKEGRTERGREEGGSVSESGGKRE